MNLKKLKHQKNNKAATKRQSQCIPVKIMVNSVHIYSQVLTNIFNDCVKSGNFPDILKYADITPVFKKGDTTGKTNYRPISTLFNFSKVFEKMIYAQISSFMEPKLSKYPAGFHGKHNTQHAFLKMIGTWLAMKKQRQ